MRAFKTVALAGAFCAAASTQSFAIASFYGIVSANGTTSDGAGVKRSRRTATGQYYVEFSRDVRGCAVQATARGSAGGIATTAGFPGFPTRVRVFTFTRTGAVADRAFNLTLFCAP
jgi:hypothetical protein